MTNLKISELTSASTPLAGTEVLAIAQSGTTVKASVSNFTAGRNVAMGNAVVGLGGALNTSTSVVLNGTSNPANGSYVQGQRDGSNVWIIGDYQSAFGSGSGYVTFTYGAVPTVFYNTSVGEQLRLDGTDVKATLGNFVQGTAAKGINFTANTPAAGMTSQLLNWYEEGTWTPNFSTWSVVPTLDHATYTRIGRQVTLNMVLQGGTCVAGSSIGGLPFIVGSAGGAAALAINSTTNSIAFSGAIFNATSTIQCIPTTTIASTTYWALSSTYFT